MKKTVSVILSLMMSLTIVICTIAQYHHHDRYGNIYITFSVLGQVELDVNGHYCKCHHCHEDGCHSSDRNEDQDCSMHLDEVRPVFTDHIKLHAPQIILLLTDVFTQYQQLTVFTDQTKTYNNLWRYKPLILETIDLPVASRRGPPCVVA